MFYNHLTSTRSIFKIKRDDYTINRRISLITKKCRGRACPSRWYRPSRKSFSKWIFSNKNDIWDWSLNNSVTKTSNGQGEPCPYKFLNLHGLKNKNARVAENYKRTQREELCVISVNSASSRLSYCNYESKSKKWSEHFQHITYHQWFSQLHRGVMVGSLWFLCFLVLDKLYWLIRQ
jgi:hypothetical protein